MRDEKTSIAHHYIARERGSIALAGALGEAGLQHLERIEFQAAPIILSPPVGTPGESFWFLLRVLESRPLEIWE